MNLVQEGENVRSVLLGLISVGAILGSAAVDASHPDYFARYFGPIQPLFALVAIFGLGFLALRFLDARTEFTIWRVPTARSLGLPALFAMPFAAMVVLIDSLVFRFPRDINVPWPQSLLFYPTMGFVVEVVLHVLPIAALIGLAVLTGTSRRERFMWAGLLLASLLEPLVQISSEQMRGAPSGRTVFVGLLVIMFNFIELYMFRNFGFIPMYVMRLVYYACWHVAWGTLRLAILF
jgi:hypothetical protein